jgi:hypothetical protein
MTALAAVAVVVLGDLGADRRAAGGKLRGGRDKPSRDRERVLCYLRSIDVFCLLALFTVLTIVAAKTHRGETGRR